MTVLIDSWSWIEYWKGGPYAKNIASYIEGDEEAIVSAINLAETYFWVTKYYNENTARNKVLSMEKRSYVVPVDRNLALAAAKVKLDHRLALADSIIYATAVKSESKVVTGDPDFKKLKNVILVPG